jgi:holliday junction resolvase Hjr
MSEGLPFYLLWVRLYKNILKNADYKFFTLFLNHMSKAKGSNAERDLIRMFWAAGWAAIRSAGSGSMQFPSPDVLAGNKIRRLAVEVKATKENKKYFSSEEVKQLQDFSSYFGAEPWFAIKFPGSFWVFINPEDLEKTQENFAFSKENAKTRGLSFEEMTKDYINNQPL